MTTVRNIPNLRHKSRAFTEHPRDRHKLCAVLDTLIDNHREKIFGDTLKITWFASGDMSPLLHLVVEWDEEVSE